MSIRLKPNRERVLLLRRGYLPDLREQQKPPDVWPQGIVAARDLLLVSLASAAIQRRLDLLQDFDAAAFNYEGNARVCMYANSTAVLILDQSYIGRIEVKRLPGYHIL
jgi:hypothetical protein